MATIEKRRQKNGSVYYLVRVYIGKDENGKRQFISTSFHPKSIDGTKKQFQEVEKFAFEMEDKVKKGRLTNSEKVTFKYFAQNDWLDFEKSQGHLSPAQLEQYLDTLEKFVFPSIGNISIEKITTAELQRLINKMSNSKKQVAKKGGSKGEKEKTEKKLSPNTIKRRFSIMRSVFDYAYKLNIIEENPCDRCTLPSSEKAEVKPLEVNQIKGLYTFIKKGYDVQVKKHRKKEKNDASDTNNTKKQHFDFPLWIQCYLHIALSSGCRRGEELALQWSDIDFQNHTICITKAAKTTKKGTIIGPPKTKTSKRTIKLDDECFRLLKSLYDEEKQLCIRAKKRWLGKPLETFDENFVFIQTGNENIGKIMNLTTPYHSLKKIIVRYNSYIDSLLLHESDDQKRNTLNSLKISPSFRLHDCRHTSASILLTDSNIDVETIATRLGHSDPTTTLRIYGHAMQKEEKDAIASKFLEQTINSQPDEIDNTSNIINMINSMSFEEKQVILNKLQTTTQE